MKRIIALLLSVLLIFVSFAGCKKPSENNAPAGGEIAVSVDDHSDGYRTDDNNRVFYEIFVGSFSDSDGDGVGDLKGILNRMDYLNDGDPASGRSLGVEGIWLTPIFSSPSYHKYDVADYYKIDEEFGSEEDLKALIEACRERNVKLILDLPINHTGRLNRWFNEFLSARRDGRTDDPKYDFYCSAEEGSLPAGRRFSPISGTPYYYECNFSDDMPELNFDNEDVRKTVLDVAKHYLDLGVDGFRFDAAKYMYFGNNAQSEEFWLWYMNELRALKPDVYAVAEVWDSDGITDIYYPSVNCFDFSVASPEGMIGEAAKGANVNAYTSYVERYIRKITSLREDAAYTPFITNHDMDRAAGFLTMASGTMRTAANLLLLGPGSPFLYYGEELGMRGSRGGANTDANRRLAMTWGDEDAVKNPVGTTYDLSRVVDAPASDQKSDGYSLYNYYKKVIMIRNANPEIARGTYTALKFTDTKVGGFISEWNGNKVCVIHNTTKFSQTVDLSKVTDQKFETLAAVIGVDNEASLDGTTLTLGAQTSVVLR